MRDSITGQATILKKGPYGGLALIDSDLVNSSLSEEAHCRKVAAEVWLSKEDKTLRQDY
jgi:hypothetical protein